jgi:hypothetical protein
MLLIAGSFTNIVAGANAVKSFVVLGLGYAESQRDERAKLYVGGKWLGLPDARGTAGLAHDCLAV